jgi:DNA-binding transcriptional MocR family regulator
MMINIKKEPRRLDTFAAAREQWLDAVFADRNIGFSAKILARTLWTHFNRLHFDQNDNLLAWPSIRTLDRETGMSRNTVVAAIRKLEAGGWIEVHRNRASGGRSQANRYFACRSQSTVRSAPGGSIRCVDAVHTGAPDSMNNHLIDSLTRHSPRAAPTAPRSQASRSKSVFDLAENKWGTRGRKIAAMAARRDVSNEEILDAMEQNDDVELFASDILKSVLPMRGH